MEKRVNKQTPMAVAFYHDKGFVPAYKQAATFAGKNGRIATMPDIVDARLATQEGTAPWGMYFTTVTAEYVGQSKGGNKVIIVAHGVGPMATLDGILNAYRYQYDDKTRERDGGRITQDEFWALESGKYGDVSVIDFKAYCARYEYPFIQQLRYSELLTDPLFKARYGARAEEYLIKHLQIARRYHAEQAGVDPEDNYGLGKIDPENHARFINRRKGMHLRMANPNSDPYLMQVGDASNCTYLYHPRPEEDRLAVAHLISTSQLMNLHHEGRESLTNEVSCHEWWNGVRLIAIRGEGSIANIHPGNHFLERIMEEKWEQLMRPTKSPSKSGFYHLIPFAEHYFTEYRKQGERMDTGKPQFRVIKMEKVKGGPKEFRTTIGGYYGFVKYGIKEVERIAPRGANAYILPGEFKIEGNYHVSAIEFYRAEVDTTRRLLRDDEVMADYNLMMSVVGVS